MAEKKVNTTNEEEKKKKKKLFIIFGSILGAGAIAGASVGIYFAVQPKTPQYEVSCEVNGVTLSKTKATKGQEFKAEIGINEQMIGEGYTLPTALTKVVSGEYEVKATEYTYDLKDDNKKADFKIPGEYVKGKITIDLELVPQDTPTTIEIDSDSTDKIKFEQEVTPIIGKEYENDFVILQTGKVLEESNPCIIKVKEEPLTLNTDFEISKKEEGKYHLVIHGNKITGKIVISNVNIVSDDEYTIAFDSTSSSLLSISPSVGKKGQPYNGAITINGIVERLDLSKMSVNIGTEPTTDFTCNFHIPMAKDNQYDFAITKDINSAVIIHAELLNMNPNVNKDSFNSALDFSSVQYMQTYMPDSVESGFDSEMWAPNIYYLKGYDGDNSYWSAERYCTKENDSQYYRYEKEYSIGAWLKYDAYEDDFSTPAENNNIVLLNTIKQYYEMVKTDDFFNAFERTTDNKGYYCDENAFSGTPLDGMVQYVELRFGDGKLFYVKMIAAFNSINGDEDNEVGTMESYFNYDEVDITVPEPTDVNYEISDSQAWQNALRFSLEESDLIDINYGHRFKGSNLYRISDPSSTDKYVYFEHDGDDYYKYSYNSTEEKYEKIDSNQEEFDENNLANTIKEIIPDSFLNYSDFEFDSEAKEYHTVNTISGYSSITICFMNGKLSYINYSHDGPYYMYNMFRDGLELEIPQI